MISLELVLILYFFLIVEIFEEFIDLLKIIVVMVFSIECKYNNEFEFYVCVYNILVFVK